MKPILVLDFDGTCSTYKSGWQGEHVANDPPVDGMWGFLEAAVHHFEIHIYSSRSGSILGREVMYQWFMRYADSGYRRDIVNGHLRFPSAKPPAVVTLDDRALTFTGVWPDVNELRAFVPWNKKKVATNG